MQLLALQLLVSAGGVIFGLILSCVEITGMLHGMIISELWPKAPLLRSKSFQVYFTIHRNSISSINEKKNSLKCS